MPVPVRGRGLAFVLAFAVIVAAGYPGAANAAGPCTAGETTLCLNQGRFQVQVQWTDFQGSSGEGRAVGLTLDTGYFWFFSPANVELMVKVLDGRELNGHFWVFYGALSNVEYTLTVTDVVSGASKTYFNPSGRLASVADTRAFPGSASGFGVKPVPAAFPAEAAVQGECFTGPDRLCLNGQRFEVEVAWKDFQGGSGTGHAVPLTDDTGYFWFFAESNVELVVKVVDGRGVNGNFWLFFGALSTVEYTITVTDTQTGATRVYTNPAGHLASLADTSAFPAGDPPVLDFFNLPAEVRTNLSAFLVAGSTAPENRVTVSGQAVAPNEKGDFAVPVSLAAGDNRIELRIESADGERRKEINVVRDAGLSTAGMALVYVDLDAPGLAGTAVLDARTGLPLGFLEGQHVRGISPDGGEIYLHNRLGLSTATHQPTVLLRFSRDIPVNGFVVSADGQRLYSRDEALNRPGNQRLAAKLPVTIETGGFWAHENVPGGPALSPDGTLLFCHNPLRVIDTRTFFLRPAAKEIYSDFISDMAMTPDGRFLLIAEYSYAAGRVKVYDAVTLDLLTTATGPGDFSGEIVFSRDGSKLVVGSAGNPQSTTDGGLTVFETATFGKLTETQVELADNLAITDRDEILVSSGNRAGVDIFELRPDGQLIRTKTAFLGVGRFVLSYNEPKADDIRKIVFKPPAKLLDSRNLLEVR
jgi:WD40 repeat protein